MKHLISKERAEQMIALYRLQREAILKPEYQGKDLLVYSETFDRQVFDLLLSQPACQRVRILYGMSEDLKVHAIVVAVDLEGKDVFMTAGGQDDEEIIIEEGIRCPPFCNEPESP